MVSDRAAIRSHPERGANDMVPDIVSAGLIVQLGFAIDGQPYIIPMSYHYDAQSPNNIYIHGSLKGRTMQYIASGEPICVAITLVDGIVFSRNAFNYSMNYRSAIGFGKGNAITDPNKVFDLFEQMIHRYTPDRIAGHDYESATMQQIAATAFVQITIEEWSAKVRTGGPKGPNDDNPLAPGTCGVIERIDGLPSIGKSLSNEPID
jgi:nitroimidazol reductase NimA-like FMN-containing flavoprotein (pyridoxamine 5'-phosphate oxidase superfamily)